VRRYFSERLHLHTYVPSIKSPSPRNLQPKPSAWRRITLQTPSTRTGIRKPRTRRLVWRHFIGSLVPTAFPLPVLFCFAVGTTHRRLRHAAQRRSGRTRATCPGRLLLPSRAGPRQRALVCSLQLRQPRLSLGLLHPGMRSPAPVLKRTKNPNYFLKLEE